MPKLVSALAVGLAALFAVFAVVALFKAAVPAITAPTLTQRDISLEQAMEIAQAAVEECKKSDSAITVAVVDRVGGIRFAVRATGATPDDLEAARRKAYTARTFRTPTSAWIERTTPGTDPVSLIGQRQLENTLAKPGGVPILLHGDAIGGVGVTGSKGGDMNDEACATAGVESVAGNLG
jgi:uncharacterized protein GlcG (DUF336 family)